ncbi:hypothetical protein ACHWQZ_G006588 [Mnemiopsis leidyi]
MSLNMYTEISHFSRREGQHGNIDSSTPARNISKRLMKRRCELERDIHDRLRGNKQERGILRSHSIFLERKSQMCFYGYHFKDSIAKDMPHLDNQQVEELAEYLFRFKYVVPVMKFVSEMSPTTVFYRYAEDERRLAPALQLERVACSELAGQIIHHSGETEFAGSCLLEILDTHLADFSVNLGNNQQFVTSHRNRLTMLCQKMLHHGYLIPETTETPERFQKFRPENKYFLCDSETDREQIREIQEERKQKIMTRTRHLSDNARALSLLRSSTLGKTCTFNFGRTRDTRPKQHQLQRSASVRTKRTSRTNLYWTLEVDKNVSAKTETDGLPKAPSVENEIQEVQSQREVKRQLSARILARDVEIVNETENIQTYAPPARKRSFPDKLKKIYKKLVGVNANINTCNTLTSVSSIDAEWSVY